MEPPKANQLKESPHILFESTTLDAKEDIDTRTERSYMNLKQMISNKSAKECHDIYLKFIHSNSPNNTEELTMGLLVAILVDQENQQSKFYRDVVSFSKDSLTLFSTYLNMIIIERLQRLREHSIKQIFWITNQLMKASINTAENICSNLIRQIAGGDLSTKNLRLIENLLDLLIENRNWLVNSTTFMVPTIIYTFMRLLADHMQPAQASLRQKEVDFVIGLIREKFTECTHIGRDFLRLLHNIVKIPEFEKLWHDIYNNPKSLHPSFQNSLTLLSFRTPRRLIQSRLTFDMEKKISFLATQVKFGNQKRYQAWFHKQYLAPPESLTLRCDLIRYICTIIHPSNEVLCSDIIPRWAIIGWLLTTCTSSASSINSKLTLFFDWLLYDAKNDNIMNIEPAILVMYYSMGSHPTVTAGLLDFLCRIPSTFSPKLSEPIKTGLKKSLQQILEKRVVQSLAPLFDNPKHDPGLRALIRETFPEFCANATVPSVIAPTILDNGISTPNSTLLVTGSPSANDQNNSSFSIPTQTSSTPMMTKQTESSLSDHESKLTTNNLSTDTLMNDSTTNQKFPPLSNENHSNNLLHQHSKDAKTNDQHTSLSGDKPEVISSLLTSPRDESKAFTWNGVENVNASYSHKQNHDIKNRKSSISITPTDNPTTALKKMKTATSAIVLPSSDEIINTETIKNASSKVPSYPSITNFSMDPVSIMEPSNDCDDSSGILKVIYPFMAVQNLNLKEMLDTFDEPIRGILEDLSIERCNDQRCNLMDRLISTVFDNSEQTTTTTIKNLGHCLANFVVDDFATRIFPSTSSHDIELLDESIGTPFFVLCRSAFSNNRSSWTVRPMSLLTAIGKFLEATGFLVLYFLRATAVITGTSSFSAGYLDYCNTAKRKLSKCLHEDLQMAATYDSEMFCFMLPSIFGELATSGSFIITGDVDLIRLIVSVIDPIYLQELICLCLTGTAKVIKKEDAINLIEASLEWESWEQYCVWKLISAQNVPIGNYIDILPKLDTKTNAEAMSCILLNLQRVTEPTIGMIQQLLNCDCKPNDLFVSSILRYWSIKTDIEDLAKSISSLFDSRPSSPQVKRKGQAKVASSAKNSTSLSSFNEKILQHLDSLRQRLPKAKLLAQQDILDMLNQMETLCNDAQRKRFADLFSHRPKATKKQKKMEKEVSA